MRTRPSPIRADARRACARRAASERPAAARRALARASPGPGRHAATGAVAPPGSVRSPRPSPVGGAPEWLRPVGLGAAACVLLGAVVLVALRLLGGGVRLDGVEPARLRVGQRATLTGSGFASDPAGNSVLFDDRQAKVLQASPTRLEVEVPEAVAESGAERRVGVVVKKGRRASRAVEVAVFQGPRLHGISPEAALPGEEVVLAGAGWGPGATVRFGDAPAQLNDLQATRIRAIVPDGAGVPGTPAPVVVTVGGVESNPAPFIVGHLPVAVGRLARERRPGRHRDRLRAGLPGRPARGTTCAWAACRPWCSPPPGTR